MRYFFTKSFRFEEIHSLQNFIDNVPHTSVEPLSDSEVIVIGGDSYDNPDYEANTAVINTVSML